MRSIVRVGRAGKGKAEQPPSPAIPEVPDARVELIQALVRLGLEAVSELRQQEVTALAGQRYLRGDGQAGYARWGQQPGSAYLSDHKMSMQVPHFRDYRARQDVPLLGKSTKR